MSGIMVPKREGASSPTNPKTRSWNAMKSSILTVLTLLAIVFGITFGVVLRNCRQDKWSQREQDYVKFGGEIFLRMLKALSLPLILSSVIAALASLDLRLSAKVGMRTFLFYLFTTLCAVFLGVILVITIHPGSHKPNEKLDRTTPLLQKPRQVLNGDVMMDMVRNMFPKNLVEATLFQYQTVMDLPPLEELGRKNETISKISSHSSSSTKGKNAEGTNMLGLLVFSTAFGLALASMGTYGKPLLKIVRCLSQLFMIIAQWVLYLSPLGIFCLLAGQMLEVKDLEATFSTAGMYVVTVLVGLGLHAVVVLPAVYFLISGTHPFKLIGSSGDALVTAFGTSSSIAALPATIACVEEKHGVDPRVTRFVLPMGAAMNMDGTALYETVAAFFLVQLHGVSLDFADIVAVSFITTISCIGISGIPQAGLVTMAMLMNVLGLPTHYIAILIPVDWILHRFRTTVNVLGDVLAANLVADLSKDELERISANKPISKDLATSVEDV